MTFTLETVFVVPVGNTLPTSTATTTSDLTAGQFGIFLPNYVPATALTAVSAKYLYIAQGRPIYAPGEGTKRSDRIYANRLLSWTKMSGQTNTQQQITTFSALTAGCNQNVSITVRLDSFYIRTAYFNGLTKSVSTTTPCCSCGSNPCDTLQDADIQTVMTALATAINADTILNKFIIATNGSSGATTTVILTGIALDVYGNACDLTAFPQQYDRLSFWTYIHTGPSTTNDYEVVDRCDTLGTLTISQRSGYPSLQSDEVAQIEKDVYSYQAEYKHILSSPLYNGEFASLVTAATTYDLYLLKFAAPEDNGFNFKAEIEESVAIYVPHGGGTTIEAILTAAYGNPSDITNVKPSSNTSTVTP
jgi:hypothetical protein